MRILWYFEHRRSQEILVQKHTLSITRISFQWQWAYRNISLHSETEILFSAECLSSISENFSCRSVRARWASSSFSRSPSLLCCDTHLSTHNNSRCRCVGAAVPAQFVSPPPPRKRVGWKREKEKTPPRTPSALSRFSSRVCSCRWLRHLHSKQPPPNFIFPFARRSRWQKPEALGAAERGEAALDLGAIKKWKGAGCVKFALWGGSQKPQNQK